MTIQEIIDREMARQGSYEAIRLVGKRHAQDVMNVACARAACLASCKAVAEACAKIAHDQVEFAIKQVGHTSEGRLSAAEDIEESIRALAAQGPGGEGGGRS